MKSLENYEINPKIKISALWVVLMLCYIYNDFFSLFTPGAVDEIMAGYMGPFPVTQMALVSATLLMALPILMIYLTLVMKPRLNQVTNIIVSALYIVVMVVSLIGEWHFYILMGFIEIIINGLIIWLAFKWPTIING